jgi:8-oxo-dGTP pyrophosphatase MutT (NUDIX family)
LPILGHQVGALAWLPETDPVRFALVTTRRSGRWVFPKGWVNPGAAPHEAAAREAFEEAGVRGTVDPVAVGTFRTAKVRPPFAWPLDITLYPLRVERVLDRWPEAGQRQRRFVTLAEARTLLAEPDMLRVAELFAGTPPDRPAGKSGSPVG